MLPVSFSNQDFLLKKKNLGSEDKILSNYGSTFFLFRFYRCWWQRHSEQCAQVPGGEAGGHTSKTWTPQVCKNFLFTFFYNSKEHEYSLGSLSYQRQAKKNNKKCCQNSFKYGGLSYNAHFIFINILFFINILKSMKNKSSS